MNSKIKSTSFDSDSGEDDIFHATKKIIEDEICKVYKSQFKENDDGLCCDMCELWTHDYCLPDGRKTYEMSENKMIWTCPECCRKFSKNSISGLLEIESNNASINDVMKLLRVLVIQSAKVIDTNVKVSKVNKQVVKLNKEVNEIKEQLIASEHNMKDLQMQVAILQQDKLNNKAICMNVPKEIAIDKSSFTHLLISNNSHSSGKVDRISKSNKNSEQRNVILHFSLKHRMRS